MEAFSNDYESLATSFKTATGFDLVTADFLDQARMATLFDREEDELTATVLIPVRGNRQPLSRCLESIAAQTYLQDFPGRLQVVVVQDGFMNDESDPLGSQLVLAVITTLRDRGVAVDYLTRGGRSGAGSSEYRPSRSITRNIGLAAATGDVVVFVDSDMILEPHFLTEHMVRHTFLSNVALLGFKENADAAAIPVRAPDPLQDWKYGSGDRVNYMQLTREFRDWSALGTTDVPLTRVFQTNISSVRRWHAYRVGGFERQLLGWGAEDTDFGGKLLANQCFLVPCPSSSAFHQTHPEANEKEEEVRANKEVLRSNLDHEYCEQWRSLLQVVEDERCSWVMHDSTPERARPSTQVFPAPLIAKEGRRRQPPFLMAFVMILGVLLALGLVGYVKVGSSSPDGGTQQLPKGP